MTDARPTPEEIAEIRERFEQWWIRSYPEIALTRFALKQEQYLHQDVHMAWEGWRAAILRELDARDAERAWRPDVAAIERAADELWSQADRHGWFGYAPNTWRDLDPRDRAEYLDGIHVLLLAALPPAPEQKP